jgi:proline utilization trans-activator
LRKSFLEKLDKTYESSTPDDPIWLSQVFVVLALGELYSEPHGGRGVPGTDYFQIALSLLPDLYEEPTVAYIETLLLIVSHSLYSTI